VGAEARCILRYRGTSTPGVALLETDELIFRGKTRLAIRYRDISQVEAQAGRLSVTFSGGVAVFELGSKAAAWAEKIRNPKALLDKLGVKPGATVVLLNVPDRGFRADLGERGVMLTGRMAPGADLVFLAVATKRDLQQLRALARRLRHDGAVWVVAPRGSTVVREADILAAGKPAGLVDVKVVRFSDTHTAHKFVIPRALRTAGQPRQRAPAGARTPRPSR